MSKPLMIAPDPSLLHILAKPIEPRLHFCPLQKVASQAELPTITLDLRKHIEPLRPDVVVIGRLTTAPVHATPEPVFSILRADVNAANESMPRTSPTSSMSMCMW